MAHVWVIEAYRGWSQEYLPWLDAFELTYKNAKARLRYERFVHPDYELRIAKYVREK